MKVNSANKNTTIAELDSYWVFGGMERGSGESCLVEVVRRAVTLLPLIAAHVRPGSIVYSNEWSAYNQLAATTSNIQSFAPFCAPDAFGKIITHIAEQYPV